MIFVYFALGYFLVGALYEIWAFYYYIVKKKPDGYEAFMHRLKNAPVRVKVLTFISLVTKWPIHVRDLSKLLIRLRIIKRRIKRIDKELSRRRGLA